MPIKNKNYKDDPLYNEKITNSSLYDSDLEFIWITGEHCKNCDDCKERDSVIKTYRGWEEIGMPLSKILACAPNNECDCAMHAIDDYGHADIFGNKYETEYFDMDGNKVNFDDENQGTHRGYWHADNIYRLDDNNKRYIAKIPSKKKMDKSQEYRDEDDIVSCNEAQQKTIENTTWTFYQSDGDTYSITFQSDGTFYYREFGQENMMDSAQTWTIEKKNMIIISFCGYLIKKGNLITDNNHMVGNWINKKGDEGSWFGIQDKEKWISYLGEWIHIDYLKKCDICKGSGTKSGIVNLEYDEDGNPLSPTICDNCHGDGYNGYIDKCGLDWIPRNKQNTAYAKEIK